MISRDAIQKINREARNRGVPVVLTLERRGCGNVWEQTIFPPNTSAAAIHRMMSAKVRNLGEDYQSAEIRLSA